MLTPSQTHVARYTTPPMTHIHIYGGHNTTSLNHHTLSSTHVHHDQSCRHTHTVTQLHGESHTVRHLSKRLGTHSHTPRQRDAHTLTHSTTKGLTETGTGHRPWRVTAIATWTLLVTLTLLATLTATASDACPASPCGHGCGSAPDCHCEHDDDPVRCRDPDPDPDRCHDPDHHGHGHESWTATASDGEHASETAIWSGHDTARGSDHGKAIENGR